MSKVSERKWPDRSSGRISRRDFLKLAGTAGAASLLGSIPSGNFGQLFAGGSRSLSLGSGDGRPNVIMLLFDALSAFNLSLYGYHRQTSPNLDLLAQRATVYHAHRTAANFTTPSTASLFTGASPLRHRAFSLGGLIQRELLRFNLWTELEGSYHRVAFTQNVYADIILNQFGSQLDLHPSVDSFSLLGHTIYSHLAPRDGVYGFKGFDEFLFAREQAHGSLFLSLFRDLFMQAERQIKTAELANKYPLGLPRLSNTDVHYSIDQVLDGVGTLLAELPQPFFAYIHLMPPHAPYLPSAEFLGCFDDGWMPPEKKKHRLAAGLSPQRLNQLRRFYDEVIAQVDNELGRLLEGLEQAGLLDNTYFIVTSDHGELFERGEHGHSTPLLYEPVIRVPLVVRAPGQSQREDVYSPTTNLDIAPSLIALADKSIPEWCEGRVLPSLGGDTSERSIMIAEAKKNPARSPLKKASLALIRGRYKLIHYMGYRYGREEFELYDLENDPDELHNIIEGHPLEEEMKAELLERLADANRLYE